MNGRLRLILCGTCVAIGAFHAPWATHVLAEDLTGTYASVVDAGNGDPGTGSLAALSVPDDSEELDGRRAFGNRAGVSLQRR